MWRINTLTDGFGEFSFISDILWKPDLKNIIIIMQWKKNTNNCMRQI